jgi:DNA invertase Pin-like site-specific DNA recombinase
MREVIVIAVYLRVSTSKQETASQRQAVERWCRQQKYPQSEIIDYIDDAFSGATLARPALQRMLADVRVGKIDKIVTFELSRLSRDVTDTLMVMRDLREYGVQVEVPGQGVRPFETAMEQLHVAIEGFGYAQERERLRARTKEGLAVAKARGVKLGRPKVTKDQPAKRGWRKKHDPKLVERILKLHRKGHTTHSIADTLTTDDKKFHQNMVYRILRRYKLAKAT